MSDDQTPAPEPDDDEPEFGDAEPDDMVDAEDPESPDP